MYACVYIKGFFLSERRTLVMPSTILSLVRRKFGSWIDVAGRSVYSVKKSGLMA